MFACRGCVVQVKVSPHSFCALESVSKAEQRTARPVKQNGVESDLITCSASLAGRKSSWIHANLSIIKPPVPSATSQNTRRSLLGKLPVAMSTQKHVERPWGPPWKSWGARPPLETYGGIRYLACSGALEAE